MLPAGRLHTAAGRVTQPQGSPTLQQGGSHSSRTAPHSRREGHTVAGRVTLLHNLQNTELKNATVEFTNPVFGHLAQNVAQRIKKLPPPTLELLSYPKPYITKPYSKTSKLYSHTPYYTEIYCRPMEWVVITAYLKVNVATIIDITI